MANNFDNIESTGFSFGEEEEGALEALVQEASGASEPSEDQFTLDQHRDATVSTHDEPEAVPQLTIQEEEPETVPQEAPEEEQQAWNLTKPEEPERVAPTPEREPAVVEQRPTPPTFTRPRLGQQFLDERAVATTIRIVDVYRSLDQAEKEVAMQLILPESEPDTMKLEQLVMGVFSVDPMLPRITKALKEAKALDPMERAFYVMELDDRLLEALGGVVTAFTGDDLPAFSQVKRTNYCRDLVKAIDVIDPPALRTIDATERVLSTLEEG